jgi:DNA-binding IclR family transcriptional regulator
MVADPATLTAASPQSVDRIFAVLGHLAGASQGDSLAGIARAVAAPKTSMVGLLAGMVRGGWLVRDARGAYQLGERMHTLALRISARADLASLARPVLASLVQSTGETALLGTMAPDADLAMYLDKVESPNPVRYTVAIGERRELYASAMGKLLLAYLEPARRDRYLRTERMQAFTPNTVTSVRDLRAELEKIREQGVARTHSERVAGASALAAPVFGPDGAFLVGLGIAGPTDRMRAQRAAMERVLKDAAHRLTALLSGGAPSP